MELRHLHYFVVLAHRQHFTQAAEELAIAQPALSQQIQALERELGVRLFERTSRRIQLTPAGEALLVKAERLLNDADQIYAEMQAFAGVTRGRLRIGLLSSLAIEWFPGLLARFHEQYPGIEFILHEDVTEQMLGQLHEGTLDVLFMLKIGKIFPEITLDKRIKTAHILTEPLLLGVAPHHRLAQQKELTITDLQTEEIILFKPGSGLRYAIIHLAQQAGFTPRVLFESGDISFIRSLVARGVGISVLPQSVLEAAGETIVPLNLIPQLPQRTILLAWHQQKASSPTVKAFLDFVYQDIEEYPWTQNQQQTPHI